MRLSKERKILVGSVLILGATIFLLIVELPWIVDMWTLDVAPGSSGNSIYNFFMLRTALPLAIVFGVAINLILKGEYGVNTDLSWLFFILSIAFLWVFGLLQHFAYPVDIVRDTKELPIQFIRWGQLPLVLYFIGLMVYILTHYGTSFSTKIIVYVVTLVLVIQYSVYLVEYGELSYFEELLSESRSYKIYAVSAIYRLFAVALQFIVFMAFGSVLCSKTQKK